MGGRRAIAGLLCALTLVPLGAGASDCTRTSTGLIPVDQLGTGTYQGFAGGLYPGGASTRPSPHAEIGETLASAVVPRALSGVPDRASGSIVFLSIGMSNTRNEFTRFVPLSDTDPGRHPRVRAINGAIGGMPAETISDPASSYWTQVDQMLAAAGASPQQVQVVWLKQANARPTTPFPGHAQGLRDDLRAIVSIAKARYPNLLLVYVSSRIYAGYATTALNPEPYAYESAFAVKWLVEDAIAAPAVPWVSWGPYLWADGLTPRASDGLTWACSDFASDGTHPNTAGSTKVANELLRFVHSDPTATIWYEGGGLLG